MGGGRGTWGCTVGISHVYHNSDLLEDCHAGGGGTCPWCPPGSAAYADPCLLSPGQLTFEFCSK